jgi:hypothetical protein
VEDKKNSSSASTASSGDKSALTSEEVDDDGDEECSGCQLSISAAGSHRCTQCNRPVHPFCSTMVGGEGWGQSVICNPCSSSSSSHPPAAEGKVNSCKTESFINGLGDPTKLYWCVDIVNGEAILVLATKYKNGRKVELQRHELAARVMGIGYINGTYEPVHDDVADKRQLQTQLNNTLVVYVRDRESTMELAVSLNFHKFVAVLTSKMSKGKRVVLTEHETLKGMFDVKKSGYFLNILSSKSCDSLVCVYRQLDKAMWSVEACREKHISYVQRCRPWKSVEAACQLDTNTRQL